MLRAAVFYQLSQEEESRAVRDTHRLLHIVRDDDDGVLFLELRCKLLDLRGGDRVKGA